MAHGLPQERSLQSVDDNKVTVERDDLLTKDSSTSELLFAILRELRELKLMIGSTISS